MFQLLQLLTDQFALFLVLLGQCHHVVLILVAILSSGLVLERISRIALRKSKVLIIALKLEHFLIIYKV